MKVLKIIGIIVAILLVVIVVFILSLKGKGHLERSITIDAPSEKVFAVVDDLASAKSWSPWFQIDENTNYEFSDNTSGVGAYYTWDSENPQVLSGRQEIIEVIPNELVNTSMSFGGMTGTYHASFILHAKDNNTTDLTWTYDGEADAIMEKFFIDYITESMLGPSYEKGLENLKTYIEGLPDPEPEILEADTTAME